MARGNRWRGKGRGGLVALLIVAVFGSPGCVPAGDGGPADGADVPRTPLDPTSDWNPSSDWAAKGDREAPDGGGGPDGSSGSDSSRSDYGRTDGGGGADADADPDGPEDDVVEPDVGESPCDPDAEDGGTCDGFEDVPEPDAGAGSEGAATKVGGEEPPYVMYLSADDSNSMASPIVARWMIERGDIVPRGVVRVYEFLNYYRIPYDPPTQGVRVVSEFRGILPEEGLYALQIGVQSYAIPAAERRPMNLTLVLDTSGSMGGGPIELERAVVAAIASSLRAGDVVSAVEWDTLRSIRLDSHVVTRPDDPVILAMSASLVAGGGTDLHAGLMMGYDLARRNYRAGWLNRVVLVSDGQANAGVTDIDTIAAAADGMEGVGIYLVGVGCGDGYNDTLMDEVTDAGRGAYVFVDKASEARRMFVDRFLETMEVAVREVQVELTLPGVFRIEEFHGEEYSADPAEVDPQHLAPDDAMVFHQILRASDPARVWAEDEVQVRVTFREPSGTREHTTIARDTLQSLIDRPAPTMRKADAIVVYAQALMRISAALERGARDNAIQACEAAHALIDDSATALGDAELRGIADLLETYCVRIAL